MLALRSQIFEIFWELVLRKIGSDLCEIPRDVCLSVRVIFLTVEYEKKVSELLGSSKLPCRITFIGCIGLEIKTNNQQRLFLFAKYVGYKKTPFVMKSAHDYINARLLKSN